MAIIERLDRVESKIDRMESNVDGLENNVDRLEAKVDRVERGYLRRIFLYSENNCRECKDKKC